MNRTIPDFIPTPPTSLDVEQTATCDASNEVSMRQADAVRSAYYADVRRGVAALSGEVEL